MATLHASPAATQQAVAAAAGDPYDVLIRCAPRQDGTTEEIWVRRSWENVAIELVKAGNERALWSTKRGGAAQRREEVQEKIRRIWREEADPIGMPQDTAAALLGFTRASLFNILTYRVGGAGKRSTAPAQHVTH